MSYFWIKTGIFFLSIGSDILPPTPSKPLSSRNAGLAQYPMFYHLHALSIPCFIIFRCYSSKYPNDYISSLEMPAVTETCEGEVQLCCRNLSQVQASLHWVELWQINKLFLLWQTESFCSSPERTRNSHHCFMLPPSFFFLSPFFKK